MTQGRTKFRTGTLRRDYHRPNRLENKSSWTRSKGINVQIGGMGEVQFSVPRFNDREIIRRALKDWKEHHSNEYRLGVAKTSTARKCVEYLRHRQTHYDALRQRVYGAAYLALTRAMYDAIAETYPWLKNECDERYAQKARQKRHKIVKAATRRSVTSMQVEDSNYYQELKPDDPITEEEEIPAFFNALSSLDQERFLYLPPFLKPDQIRERRFGENANDRWWEWEEELGLESDAGRHNPIMGEAT